MYVIEQDSISAAVRRDAGRGDVWDLKRQLGLALLERSRGVSRRMRADLQRRFAAAWTWVREEEAFGLVQTALLRGGLDRTTLSAERRRGVDHLVFLAGLGWGGAGTQLATGGATGGTPESFGSEQAIPGTGTNGATPAPAI